MSYTAEDVDLLGSVARSKTVAGRLLNACKWITFVCSIVAWIVAFRLWTPVVGTSVAWLVVGARLLASSVRQARGPNDPIQLYLDRVVWYSILFVPIAQRDWGGLIAAAALWAVWGAAAGLGRYWLALAVQDAKRPSAVLSGNLQQPRPRRRVGYLGPVACGNVSITVTLAHAYRDPDSGGDLGP